LRNLQQEIQKTIVFVTHDMDEALKIADMVVVMRDGKIEQTGSPQELINEPANDFLGSFFGLDRVYRPSHIWRTPTVGISFCFWIGTDR